MGPNSQQKYEKKTDFEWFALRKVWIPIYEGAGRGRPRTSAFLTKSVSFCICLPPAPSSSSGTSSFFNLLSPPTSWLHTPASDGLP